MPKNQLFKIHPNKELVEKLLNIFGINDFCDNHYFTKEDLIELETVKELNKLKEALRPFYIPCKAKIYLEDINEKRAITILRQFLKTQNYNLYSKEKFIKNIKYNTYTVISIDNNVNINKNKDRKIIINFE
tara:strand:- start:198 stop:590 length:393 start_codon:yes stop_codon:yes gene_type:complete